ncbi:MAG: SemiSWEET family sugar transporter [Alphaproteobacteria bacterium]|nr:SemiSWEET family sugar transporter [Alphaproteobacteria bacterium]
MSPNLVSALGATAALCTTGAYLPQLIRAWRTRSTRDISLPMFSLMVFGNGLWLVYGLLIGDGPLIAANAVSVSFTASILYLKLRHG